MIWSGLHGDMQSAAEMTAPPRTSGSNITNGPKVRSLAPVVSNGGVCIRLYAGNSGGSDGTQTMSDNPIGADNQQESLSPEWVVGFVDGEGCFFVGINRQPTMKVGWQVLRRPNESRFSESSEAIRRISSFAAGE